MRQAALPPSPPPPLSSKSSHSRQVFPFLPGGLRRQTKHCLSQGGEEGTTGFTSSSTLPPVRLPWRAFSAGFGFTGASKEITNPLERSSSDLLILSVVMLFRVSRQERLSSGAGWALSGISVGEPGWSTGGEADWRLWRDCSAAELALAGPVISRLTGVLLRRLGLGVLSLGWASALLLRKLEDKLCLTGVLGGEAEADWC